MERYLKMIAGFLLLAQAFHLALLQNSTDSPRRPFDPSWLRRDLVKNTHGSQNTATDDHTGQDGVTEEAGTVSSGAMNGTPVGSAASFSGEGETSQDTEASEKSDGVTEGTVTVVPVFPNGTIEHPVSPDATVSSNSTTTDSTLSDQNNPTEAGEDFQKISTSPQTSTTHPNAQNSTSSLNYTDIQETQPESNTTDESTPEPDNSTESNSTVTTAEVPRINETSTTSSSITFFPSETTEMSPASTTTEMSTVTTTPVAPDAPEEANVTDNDAASGSSLERGVASNPQTNRRKEAWGAVLGTAVALACVGLVAYVILKKRNQKDFSHRKLVEDFPADPVLRLENSEPLDLNYGGAAYYNPGLQGDNIQMSNFPGSYRN